MVQRYAHHHTESLRAGIEILDREPAGISTKLYMDPAFAATTACHVMHQVKTGLRVYIRPLGGPQLCPGLDEIRARSPH
jgi:hypothetical protein